jgi:membrane protease YdiL (CAAX protease family)
MATRLSLPIPLALAAVFGGVGALLLASSPAVSGFGLKLGLIAAEGALVLPGLAALALLGRPVAESLALGRLGGSRIGLAILAGAALWGASLGLFETQSLILPPSDAFLEAFERLHEGLAPSGIADGLGSLVAIALTPALCEEILFRGILLRSLGESYGWAAGIVGAAILFGLIHVMPLAHHLSFYRVPFAFSVGIGLGLLRVRSASLLPAILAHGTLNAITFLAAIPLVGQDLPRGADPMAPFGPPLLIVGTGAFFFLLKRFRPLTSEDGPA